MVYCISTKGFGIHSILPSDRCQLVTFGAFIIAQTLTVLQLKPCTSIGHLWHPLFDNLIVMTMWSIVFPLKDSGFIRSSRVADASWLRLVPSLLYVHLQGYKLNRTSKCCQWHPLYVHLFGRTMRYNVFLLKDSGFIWSPLVINASWLGLMASLLHVKLRGHKFNHKVAYGSICLFICLEGQCGSMYFF